jgi:hypothetical protein
MNLFEQNVKKMLEDRGFRVIRNGWPDFLCLRKHVKQQGVFSSGKPNFVERYGLMGVEVKSRSDRLSATQIEVHKALQAARIPVFVVRPDDFNDERFRTRHFLTGGEIGHFSDGIERARREAEHLQSEIDHLHRRLHELRGMMEAASTYLGDAGEILEQLDYGAELVEHEEVDSWPLPDPPRHSTADEAAPPSCRRPPDSSPRSGAAPPGIVSEFGNGAAKEKAATKMGRPGRRKN